MTWPNSRPNPGSAGGKASAARLTQEQRVERATRGGNRTLERYGLGYFSALAKSQRKKASNGQNKE